MLAGGGQHQHPDLGPNFDDPPGWCSPRTSRRDAGLGVDELAELDSRAVVPDGEHYLLAEILEQNPHESARFAHVCCRAGTISATDAIVAAFASTLPDPVVITSDPDDLNVSAAHTARPINVAIT